jgi:hypothetical protein
LEDDESFGLYPLEPHWIDKVFAWIGIGTIAFVVYLMIVWFNAVE